MAVRQLFSRFFAPPGRRTSPFPTDLGPVAPAGFVLLLGADGAQLLGADGAPLYGIA